jgi:nitrogen fixation/metabolism regulation signal transduction histidine kinase
MIVFSGMILILTVGAVCALLYRQVFLPIKQLADFTEGPVNGRLSEDFPEVSGDIARLARSFQEMTNRVHELETQASPRAGDGSQ